MIEFIIYAITFSVGVLAGVALMCLFQINKNYGREDIHNEEKEN